MRSIARFATKWSQPLTVLKSSRTLAAFKLRIPRMDVHAVVERFLRLKRGQPKLDCIIVDASLALTASVLWTTNFVLKVQTMRSIATFAMLTSMATKLSLTLMLLM